jgi:hypothetical protein
MHELMVRNTVARMLVRLQEYEQRKRRVEQQIARIPLLKHVLGEDDFRAVVAEGSYSYPHRYK